MTALPTARPTLDKAIDCLFETAAIPELWPSALDSLGRAVSARGAFVRSLRPLKAMPCSPDIRDSVDLFFEQGWHLQDLRAERATQRRIADRFFSDQDIFSAKEIETHPFYTGYARAADVPWFAAAAAFDPLGDSIAFTLYRSSRQGPFTPTEMAALDGVLPRVTQLAGLAMRLAGEYANGLITGLDSMNKAAILLGRTGDVVGVNAAAAVLMGDGIVQAGTALVATHREARKPLADLIAAAVMRGKPHERPAVEPVRLPRVDGRPLIAQAAPLGGQAQDVFRRARALLLLDEVGSANVPDEALLRLAFGLTRAEARIGRLIIQGWESAGIGVMLQLSRATVRHHIKYIFRKAGVSRQAAFVSLASGLCRILAVRGQSPL